MNFITKKQDLIDNILTLEGYLTGENTAERRFAEQLIQRGKTICVYKVNGENHFAPSRFLGYKNNTIDDHLANEEKDGRDKNPVIDKILGRHFGIDTIEEKFKVYTISLGLSIPANKRRYWRVNDQLGNNINIKL